MPNYLNSLVPGSVTVAFRKAVAGVLTEDRYPVTVTLPALALPEYTGAVGHEGVKLFRDHAVALFASSGDAAPTNLATLTALAQRVARDWYGRRLGRSEVVLVGPVRWDTDAFCDHVDYTHRGGKDNPQISTRVRRSAWNDWTEELLHATTYPAGSGAPVDPDDPSEEIWARLTGHNADYAHSWIKVKRIPPTPGEFPLVSGTNFEDDYDSGLSGLFNAFERNRFPNVPKDSWVKLFPWGDNKWVFDYEYDHFSSPITGELGGGGYLVQESYPPDSSIGNARNVVAKEFNLTEGIPLNTKVKVWVYRVGENLEYWFDRPLVFGCDIQSVGCEADCGESLKAAREDHAHDYAYNDATPQPTDCDPDPGVSCYPAREDHVHDITFGDDIQSVGAVNLEGTDCLPARSDHVHAMTWPSCSAITVTETDVRCENYSLNVYLRTITINVVEGCLTKSVGSWVLDHSAGCCDCCEMYWCVDCVCVQACEEPEGATAGPFATPEECAEACYEPWWCVDGDCVQECEAPVGYTSGPHASESECLGSGCGDPGCCEGEPLPFEVLATLEYESGDCDCGDGTEVSLTNDTYPKVGSNNFPCAGEQATITLTLSCTSTYTLGWSIDPGEGGVCAGGSGTVNLLNEVGHEPVCDPLSLWFRITNFPGDCCGGTGTQTVLVHITLPP